MWQTCVSLPPTEQTIKKKLFNQFFQKKKRFSLTSLSCSLSRIQLKEFEQKIKFCVSAEIVTKSIGALTPSVFGPELFGDIVRIVYLNIVIIFFYIS